MRAKFHQVDEFRARDDDVLVEFVESGVAQGVGKFAAELPDGLASGLIGARLM